VEHVSELVEDADLKTSINFVSYAGAVYCVIALTVF